MDVLLCLIPLLLLLSYSVAKTEADDPKGNSFIYIHRTVQSSAMHSVQCSAVQCSAVHMIQSSPWLVLLKKMHQK